MYALQWAAFTLQATAFRNPRTTQRSQNEMRKKTLKKWNSNWISVCLKCRRHTALEKIIWEYAYNISDCRKEWRPPNGLQISRLSTFQPGNMDFLPSTVVEYSVCCTWIYQFMLKQKQRCICFFCLIQYRTLILMLGLELSPLLKFRWTGPPFKQLPRTCLSPLTR